MKKGVAIFLMILIILVAFILPDLLKKNGEQVTLTTTELNLVTVTTESNPEIIEYDWSYKIDNTEPLTRGLLAKMLALVSNSKNELLQNYDREIGYKDTDPESWYDKYINVIFIENIYRPEGDNYEPFKNVDYGTALQIAEKFGVKDADIPKEIKEANSSDTISIQHWYELYKQIIAIDDVDNEIKTVDIVVIGTPANIAGLNPWELVSDKGKYVFEGLNVDRLLDKKIRVLVRGSEIIAVLQVVEDNPLITNAWIDSASESLVRIFMYGEFRDYSVDGIIEAKNSLVGDLQLMNGKVESIRYKTEAITGKVLRVNGGLIEIEEMGTYEFTPDYKIYSVYNQLESKTISSLIVGYNVGEYIIDNGKVCAAVIRNAVVIDKIRVLISNNTMGNYNHEVVKVTSDVAFTVAVGENLKTYNPKDVYEVSQGDLAKGRIIIGTNGAGKIQLLTVKRGSINPSYRGTLEVIKSNEEINVVNELNFEQYLYAVLPGEMSTSVDIEALKVQAVCARSFAYSRFYANSYCSYGAHVDDSVASQVYNTVPEDEKSIKAVVDTKGLMLRINGNVIAANFFSTSCGVTSNSGEVWSSATREFPTYTPNYLKARTQNEEAKEVDLSDELVFTEFIKNYNFESYDSSYAWYRWNVNMTLDQITASVNANLANRYQVVPKLIKTLGEDGKYRSREISTVGQVKDVKVYSRGKSGILTEILIIGTEATIKVATEYNIRLLLAPKNYISGGSDIILTRKDGSTQTNMSMMPSGYFIMQKVQSGDTLQSINFIGGGYGHGVGMSQNGAKTMIGLGKTFLEVLQHYYNGVVVSN